MFLFNQVVCRMWAMRFACATLVLLVFRHHGQAQVDAAPVRILSENGIEVWARRTEPGLGMQGVGWRIKNLTGDTLRVHLSKTFYSTTGRLVKRIDGTGSYSGVVIGPYEMVKGARLLGDDVVLWNDFFYDDDLQKGELIGRIQVAAKVINLSRERREKARQKQLAIERKRQEEIEKQKAVYEAQRQQEQQRDLQAKISQQQKRMISQLNESARQRGAALNNLVSSLNSIGSRVMAEQAKRTIARMNDEREQAFEYLMEDARDGQGEIVDCGYCRGEGLESCEECYGNGYNECSNCDRGRQRCWTCGGSGAFLNLACTSCGGRGSSECTQCFGQGQRICTYCGGLGRNNCRDCSGTGKEFVERDTYVPPYADNESNRYPSHNLSNTTAADIPEISAMIEGLYFYAGRKKDSLRTDFRFVTTGDIQYMVKLSHPRAGRRVEYELEFLCTDPMGRTKTVTRKSYVEPDWTNSYFWGNVAMATGTGNLPGSLIPGKYRVQVRNKNNVIADKSFNVFLLKQDLQHPLVRGPSIGEQRLYAGKDARVYKDTFATGVPLSIWYEARWTDPAPELKLRYPVWIQRYSPGKPLYGDFITLQHEGNWDNIPLANGKTRSHALILGPMKDRTPGKYSVEFSLGGKLLSSAAFHMTDEPDISDINGYVTGIGFFWWDGKSRHYNTRFSQDSLNNIYYELRLKYEPVPIMHRSIFVDVSCIQPNGKENSLGQQSVVIAPDWNGSRHRWKLDPNLIDSRAKGVYWIEYRYEGKLLGKNWFEID